MASVASMTNRRLATALFLLFASWRFAMASLEIYQREFQNDSLFSKFPVEGIATIQIGGSIQGKFAFDCISTNTSGESITWTRIDGIPVLQTDIDNGVQLNLRNAVESDVTLYNCSEKDTQTFVLLDLTTENPSAVAVEKDGIIDAFVGEEVVIKFYASGLPAPQPGNITWLHNNLSNFTWGDLSADSRSLTIPDIQLHHAGEYKFRILYTFSIFFSSKIVSTIVNVMVPPSVVMQPNSVIADEWDEVNLTCRISATPPLLVEWLRVDGASLPSMASELEPVEIDTNLVEATLQFKEARVSDKGVYYCVASPQNFPTYSASSLPAQLQVNAKVQFVYGGSSQQLSTLLFINDSITFPLAIDCRASGNLGWTSPSGTNVSLNTSENLHQENTASSRNSLTVQSWEEELNGVYTCYSDVQRASDSLTITNSNPVVVAEEINMRVALNQTAVLRVEVAGNPEPVPADIEWYKGDTVIMTDSLYTITSDRQSLIFNATSGQVAGIYECHVTTSEGMSSAFFNVTFPDPPVVMVFPPGDEVLIGQSVSFMCNVTSSLDYTLLWRFEGSLVLPEGVMVDGTMLKIPSVEPFHSGIYACEANDQVTVQNFEAQLIVNYPPEAKVGLTENDKATNFTQVINEGGIPPSFSCFYTGHPLPDVTWTLANGEMLPSNIKQISAKTGVQQLQFTSGLDYNSPVSFICSASNSLETAQALLELVIRVPPTVLSIVPAFPVVLNTSFPLSFTVPPSDDGSALTCLARGLPPPVIEWYDQDNQPLANAQTQCFSGAVSKTLNLADISDGVTTVRCTVTNDFGTESKTVQLYTGESIAPSLSSTLPSKTDGSAKVNFTLRVLTSGCLQSNQMMAQLNKQLQKILTYTISFADTLCNEFVTSSSIAISRSFCSKEVDGATVFSGIISTGDPGQTELLYTELRDWYSSGPVLFLDGIPYGMDLECDLLVPADTQSECHFDMSTSVVTTPGSGPPQDQTVLIIVIIATAIGFLLLIIFILFICVCILTCRKTREHRFPTKNWPTADTELTSSWKHNSNSSARTAETYITGEMEHNPEYDRPQHFRQSLQRFSSSLDKVDAFIPCAPRQLPTASSREEGDASSPQGIDPPSFQVALSAPSHHHHSFMSFSKNPKHAMLTASEEDLPEEEQLYQQPNNTDKVHQKPTSKDEVHEYAQIVEPDYTEVLPRHNQALASRRRATLATVAPAQPSPRQTSTLPRQVNGGTPPNPFAPRVPIQRSSGSTPVLLRVQPLSASPPNSYAQCIQPCSQASVVTSPPMAQPYQLPVASQHSLSNFTVEEPACQFSTTLMHDASRGRQKMAEQANGVKSNQEGLAGVLPLPDSTEEQQASLQPWYKTAEADSIPVALQTDEIPPYAMMPNCKIQPNPYQEPSRSPGTFKRVKV